MDRINVTQPYMPPLDEFIPYLEDIWATKQLTNNGTYHNNFELALADYLSVNNISLFSNGTLALVTALQALRISGEVITTPYSFPATTHALWWNNIKPVFVDIEPDTFNIDPKKIESAITPKTTAILAVHVYGYPCRVEAIQNIADTYGLKVIYDACHAFGVTINNQSVLDFGDMSILSFHATKVFNTFEGGAIVSRDSKTKKRIDYLKNFGFYDETTVVAPGINAKMNEVQAAFGLLQLKYIDEAISKRKVIADYYRQELKDIDGIKTIQDIPGIRHCYPYFPILIDESEFRMSRNAVYEKLREYNIYSRRYFYPLISQFASYRDLESAVPGNLPIAEKITEQVLCLPIYPALTCEDVSKITRIIKGK